MEWFAVLLLIIFGIALLLVEVIFVPGTTFVGIIGFISVLIGVGLSYQYFGNTVGGSTTIATGIITAIILYWGFRSKAWKRFALTDAIDSRVNQDVFSSLQVGDVGESTSALRPMGNAEFGGRTYEVRSLGSFVEAGVSIRIIKIEKNTIIIEPNL